MIGCGSGRFRQWISLSLLVVVFTAKPAFAQDNWRKLETENLVFVGDASDGSIRRVAEQLEDFRRAILTVYPGFREAGQVDTTVIVFDNDRTFQPFKPQVDGEPANIAGYFQEGRFYNYIALTGERETERSIYHEYVHQLTSTARDWPLWFREGIAEYLSTLEIRDGGREVLVGRAIDEHLRWLQRNRLGVERLFSSGFTPSFDERGITGTFYAEAWALTHFLISQEGGLARLDAFLSGLSDADDVESAFEAAFGLGFDETDDQIDRFIGQSRFPAIQYRLGDRLEEVDRVDTAPISEAEASFYLGDLLFHIGRGADATGYLERSVELDGAWDRPLVSLSTVARESGGPGERRGWLERAVALEDAGYLAHFLYADSLIFGTGGGPDEEDQELAAEALRRSLQLHADQPDALSLLGQILVRSPETIDEAVEVLGRAFVLDQTDASRAVVYLRALWMSGDTAGAESGLVGILERYDDPDVIASATSLLDEIRRFGDVVRGPGGFQSNVRLGTETAATGIDDGPPPFDRAAGATTDSVLSDSPRLMLAPVPEGMMTFTGDLTLLDCSGEGVRITVSGSDSEEVFETADPAGLEMVSYSATTLDSIECGPIDPSRPVRMIFDPDGAAGDVAGRPVRLEFLPVE